MNDGILNRLKKISLGNWILIGMILGVIVGLFLNLFVENNFEDVILMDNVFYLGGNIFIRLMKMTIWYAEQENRVWQLYQR